MEGEAAWASGEITVVDAAIEDVAGAEEGLAGAEDVAVEGMRGKDGHLIFWDAMIWMGFERDWSIPRTRLCSGRRHLHYARDQVLCFNVCGCWEHLRGYVQNITVCIMHCTNEKVDPLLVPLRSMSVGLPRFALRPWIPVAVLHGARQTYAR